MQLPPSWNVRPRVSLPLHVAFISGDFRAHVTAHLLQVEASCARCGVLSRNVTELWCCARWSQPITALQRLLFPPIFPLQTAFKHFDSKRIRVSCFALTPSDNSKFRRLIESNVAAGDFHDV